MKKIKFFAIVAMLGLSINAMAAKVEYANTIFRYTYEATDLAAGATIIGFVDGADVAALEIPSVVNANDAGKTEIPVVAVGSADGTFAGNEVVTSLTIPAANVATIYTAAFANCKNLATVTFAERGDTDPVLAIQAGAFEGTAITELDLTNTKMATLNPLFTSKPATTWTKNKKLTTIKLPKTLAAIAANAFDNCMLLENIDFSKCETNLTINKEAFEGTIFLEELELPACVAAIKDDAFAGSSITTLTINSHKTAGLPTIGNATSGIGGDDLTTIIVKGDFKGEFGDGTKPVSTTITSLTFKGAVGDGTNAAILAEAATTASLTKVTFEGEVKAAAIDALSFYKATKLATVEFKGNLAAGAVVGTAFGDGTDYAGKSLTTGKLAVTYKPTESTATKVASFDVDAFQTSAKKTTSVAKFSTSTWYSAWLKANQDAAVGLYGVTLDAAAATKKLNAVNNGEGKYFYAILEADGNYKIAASQNGGKVMVYAAYMDQVGKTNTAYMDQLQIVGGYYYVRADAYSASRNKGVVVKSTVAGEIEATAMTDEELGKANLDSYHYVIGGGTTRNEIVVTNVELLGQELINEYTPYTDTKNYDVYFLAPFEDYGLLWSKFKATRTLPEGTFYLTALKAASADRLNVVWLDGSEEDATAIQTVKKANAENGAIYNLAGQKVNAAYKGVVIKDGKKYIQK